MNPLQVIYFVNSFLFLLSLTVVIIFIEILIKNMTKWREPFFSAAMSIFVCNVGEALRNGWLVYWYYQHKDTSMAVQYFMHWSNVVFLILSIFIISAGTVCALRVFSYERYGHWSWVGAVFVSGLIAVILAF